MNTENYERRRFETEYECDVPTFGHPVGNEGWVRCRSKTFPGKYYFFNVDSRSRTWGRPLASCVPMPIVNSANLPKDEDFWDEAPIEVSDIEDDDEDFKKENIDTKPPTIGAKEAKRRKIFTEVLFKLYHCYGDDYCNGGDIVDFTTSDDAPLICKTEIAEDLNSSDESPSILPEICYSSSSDGESCELRPCEKRHRSYSSRSVRATLPKRCTNGKNCLPLWWGRPIWPEVPSADCLRIGKLKLSPTVDPIERQVNFWTGRNSPFSNHKGSRQTFASIGLDSEDADEEDDEEIKTEDIKKEIKTEEIRDDSRGERFRPFLPRLKAIEFSDLVTDPTRPQIPKIKVPPKRKAPPKKIKVEKSSGDPPPKKVTKIIYEMNGIKTINYDFLDPELPPGVRASNLSDSGSSTTEIAYNWARDATAKSGLRGIDAKSQNSFVIKDEFADIEEPCLSDSATSSSSSSSNGSTTTKRSNSSDSESDSSESSGTSSSGSSSASHTTRTPAGSISDMVKKEEPDPEGISTPRARNGSVVKFPVASNFNCNDKVKSESSGSSRSSDNGDCTWIRSDSQTDDDE